MNENFIICVLALIIGGLFFLLSVIAAHLRNQKKQLEETLQKLLILRETTQEFIEDLSTGPEEKSGDHLKELKTICDFYNAELKRHEETINNLKKNRNSLINQGSPPIFH